MAVAFGWAAALLHGVPTAVRGSEIQVAPPGPVDRNLAADHARARAAIEEVLSGREFADLHADPHAFSRRLLEWIGSLLDRISDALSGLPRWVFWAIVAWLVLTLVAILAHLIYTLWTILGGASRPAGAGSSARGRRSELLGIRDLEFDPVYAEARRLLGAGDWAAATRYLYVAAILWLDRQGWVAFRPSKTDWDYVRELRVQARLQGLMRGLTQVFEAVVYGGQPATTSTTHEMASTLEGLLHEPARAVAS